MRYIAQVGNEFYAFMNKQVKGLIYSMKLSGEDGIRFERIDEDTAEVLKPSLDSLVAEGNYLEGEALDLPDYRNLLKITPTPEQTELSYN